MRTKSLILGAALLAAGVASSMAQSNVYSLNIVGYVNLQLTNGFNLISNPLDLDGTGTNNTLTTVFGTNLPSGSQVYKFSGGGYNTSDGYISGVGWLAGGTLSMNPGEGASVSVPSSATVTIVGQVLQGSPTPTTNKYSAGFSILSSQAPLAGGIQTVLGFSPQSGDQLYFWDNPSQSFATSAGYLNGVGWLPSEPSLAVGQAFFLSTGAASAWTNSFAAH